MRVALLGLGLTFSASAMGQTTKIEDPISTSRPSFSDTPQIVPVRQLQIEAGASAFSRSASSPSDFDLGEALLRYGLRPRVEVRLGLPTYFDYPRGSPSGFDNTSVGASVYLGRFAGVDAGVIPTLLFPTGARAIREEAVTPALTLNLARDLGGGRSLGGTFAQFYEKGATRTLATLVYAHPLGLLTAFAEYAGTFVPGQTPAEFAHFGLQRNLSRLTQVDVHGGVGLTGGAAHSFIGAGYSVRL